VFTVDVEVFAQVIQCYSYVRELILRANAATT